MQHQFFGIQCFGQIYYYVLCTATGTYVHVLVACSRLSDSLKQIKEKKSVSSADQTLHKHVSATRCGLKEIPKHF